MGTVRPYIVQSPRVVQGLLARAGTVVDLDVTSERAAEYGGTANLTAAGD